MARLCPICKRPIPPEMEGAACRPFCSPRCKTIDLGGWLAEAYRIASPLAEEDLDEGSPREGGGEAPSGSAKGKPS